MVKRLMSGRGLWFALTLSVLFVVVGCSSNSPLAPNADDPASLTRTMPSVIPVELPAAATSVEVTLPIQAAAGGVIPIASEGYNHAFVVKPEGVSSDVLISAKVGKTTVGGRTAVEFEFGPEGLVFNEASELEFDIGELNAKATTAKLYYYDPRACQWILQGESQVVKGVVVFDIYHFSRYAISD